MQGQGLLSGPPRVFGEQCPAPSEGTWVGDEPGDPLPGVLRAPGGDREGTEHRVLNASLSGSILILHYGTECLYVIAAQRHAGGRGRGRERESRGTLCKPSSYCVSGAVPIDRGLAAQLDHLVQPQLPAVDGGGLGLQSDDELLRVLGGGQARLEDRSRGWDLGDYSQDTPTWG